MAWHTGPNAMAKPTGRPRGRPANKLKCDPADLPRLALFAKNREQLMEQTGLPHHAASALRAATIQNVEDFAESQRAKLQELFDTLSAKLARETDQLTAMQTAITLGIVADKLNQAPKAINQALHLHIKGDATSALQSILGPAAKSVFARPAPQDSKAPNYLPARPTGPVIDAETTEAS